MSNAAFAASWNEAEQTVYTELLAATGSTDGKNAFRGYMPLMLDVWSLNTGTSGNNEQTTWAPSKASIHVNAEIVGRFSSRADAMAFVMRCASVMPITKGSVQSFRIRLGGWPRPEPDIVELGNEARKVLVFTVVIGCELVWNTGGIG